MHIEDQSATPGDYRIVENQNHGMGSDWPWRFGVQQLNPPGKFLFWSWGPKWVWVTSDDLRHREAQVQMQRLLSNEPAMRVVDVGRQK